MVGIGRDGTITVQKLEGSQIRFHSKSSHFMAPQKYLFEPNAAHHGKLRGYHRIRTFGVAWTFPIFSFCRRTYRLTDCRFARSATKRPRTHRSKTFAPQCPLHKRLSGKDLTHRDVLEHLHVPSQSETAPQSRRRTWMLVVTPHPAKPSSISRERHC